MPSKILLIEDDPTLRFAVSEFLRSEEFDCRDVSSGQEGLELLSEWEPDLIITDLLMPGKDGLQVITEVRELGRAIPILVMTGGGVTITSSPLLDIASTFGANETVLKPFTNSQLLEKIKLLLES
jgi:DNA-binding response OmpR family regulator